MNRTFRKEIYSSVAERGLDISNDPRLLTQHPRLVERGVYAIAALRGGALRKARSGHRAVMLDPTETVLRRLPAARSHGWIASGDHVCEAAGGLGRVENCGLLFGAALTQWPSLCFRIVCSHRSRPGAVRAVSARGDWTRVRFCGVARVAMAAGYSPYHRVVTGWRTPRCGFTVFTTTPSVTPHPHPPPPPPPPPAPHPPPPPPCGGGGGGGGGGWVWFVGCATTLCVFVFLLFLFVFFFCFFFCFFFLGLFLFCFFGFFFFVFVFG